MIQQSNKTILFVFSSDDLLKARELLDVILMASTFNASVSIVFIASGVLLLNKHQSYENTSGNNFVSTIAQLSSYDINKIHIDEEALKEFNLTAEDLVVPGLLLATKEIIELLHSHDLLMSF